MDELERGLTSNSDEHAAIMANIQELHDHDLESMILRGYKLQAQVSARIGFLLIDLKRRTAHGKFESKLKKLGIPSRSARDAMSLARAVAAEPRLLLINDIVLRRTIMLSSDRDTILDLAEGQETDLVEAWRGSQRQIEPLPWLLERAERERQADINRQRRQNKAAPQSQSSPEAGEPDNRALYDKARADAGVAVTALWNLSVSFAALPPAGHDDALLAIRRSIFGPVEEYYGDALKSAFPLDPDFSSGE